MLAPEASILDILPSALIVQKIGMWISVTATLILAWIAYEFRNTKTSIHFGIMAALCFLLALSLFLYSFVYLGIKSS